MAEVNSQQDCPAFPEAIRQQGRHLRDVDVRRTAESGLPRPDAAGGPVSPASRNAAAAAGAAGAAAAVAAGHQTEVDLIQDVEVNPGI